jgi:hypothetical protein
VDEMPKSQTKKSTADDTPVSVRFDKDVRAALEKAAKEDRRPISHMINKLVADGLKAQGFLK